MMIRGLLCKHERLSGTPGMIPDDFVGASHSALVEMLQADYLDPVTFLRCLVETIEEHGATHNQRSLLNEAFGRATEPH